MQPQPDKCQVCNKTDEYLELIEDKWVCDECREEWEMENPTWEEVKRDIGASI